MPAQCRLRPRPVDNEVMPLGLEQHGVIQSLVERRRAAITQGIAQIYLVVPAQAQNNCPVAVSRTRLQLSQKLWLIGVMKPRTPPVSATCT